MRHRVHPASRRVEAAQIPFVAQIGERGVEQPLILGGGHERIGVVARRNYRQRQRGKRPEQDLIAFGTTNAAPKIALERLHDRSQVRRAEELLRVDPRRQDREGKVVTQFRIRRAE